MARSILIVEDDKEIREFLANYLRKEGFEPITAADGETGWAKAQASKPALVLLDILLPGMDGIELLRRMRADLILARTPVVMITAKTEPADRIVGLELGADDYIPKPFSPREVVARIKVILRRGRELLPEAASEMYAYRGVRLDVARHEVSFEGKHVPLTSLEFRILQALLSASGRVLSREAILDKAWGEETFVADRTVDVHIARLRQKIPFLAKAIQTVKDVGYKLGEA